MKLRNLISAALLVGVGSTALPAAASIHTEYPTNLPSNCRITTMTSLPLLDIRGNEPSLMPGFFVVTCTAPARPRWMTW